MKRTELKYYDPAVTSGWRYAYVDCDLIGAKARAESEKFLMAIHADGAPILIPVSGIIALQDVG